MKKLSNIEAGLKKKALLIKKACNAADTANRCQPMSRSHEEKDLKRNENVNLLLNKKTPH